ncbi:ATP-binding protein [Pseudoclavibacter helvolus]|uniref:ATP-binding protein n=1 Tax=Pseudoclavibacter helvolus TaxID=255205 RepID=UPI000837C2EC|nr:ATP-binding protein [Pseudoclavibacter helvolus]
MTRTLRLNPLGVDVELTFEESISAEFEADLRESWADVSGEPGEAEPDETHRLSLAPLDEPEVSDVVGGSAADLASQLSTIVTLDAIEHNGGRLVMIHAAGIALDDGRVIAFVGPSGRGKTTLARSLGREYGYVTDETLAVDFDGNVLPYRKPLSVIVDPSEPKAQLSPAKLGLRPLPDAPLRIAAIVLLHRVEEHELEGGPQLSPVATGSAIGWMVPELSYLPALPDPLVQLAELIDSTDGVRRVTYSEASQVVDLVPEILSSHGDVQPWTSGHSEPDATTPSATVGEDSYRRAAGVHWLLFANEAVTLESRMVRQLAGIAPGLWELLGEWTTLTQLTAELMEQYGEVADARQLVQVALDGLLEANLVERVQAAVVGTSAVR